MVPEKNVPGSALSGAEAIVPPANLVTIPSGRLLRQLRQRRSDSRVMLLQSRDECAHELGQFRLTLAGTTWFKRDVDDVALEVL